MKKIFKSQLFYLIVLVIVNVATIISICVVTFKKFEYPKEYKIEKTNVNYDTVLTESYEVKKGDLTIYENYDSYVEPSSNMFSEYILDTTNVKLFSEIKNGDKIGVASGNDVFSTSNSYCLSIAEDEGKKVVTVYNYNMFNFVVELDTNSYLIKPFEIDKTYDVDLVTGKYSVVFKGYDYTEFGITGKIKATFKMSDNNLLITEDTLCTIYKTKKEYRDVYYMDSIAFNNLITERQFVSYVNGQAEIVMVSSSEIVNGNAIIESKNGLQMGQMLYVK